MNNDYRADILVANDSREELRLLSSFLTNKGYHVRQAVDGEMALIAVETRLPDLILLDLHRTEPNGNQIFKHWKKEKKNTRDIPVIFLENSADYSERTDFIKCGQADCITKPYNFEQIIERIELHLNLSLIQRKLTEENDNLRKQVHILETIQEFQGKSDEGAELLKMVIAAAQNGIVITDATVPENPIVYVNPGFERMTGYSFNEVVGQNCRFLQGTDDNQSGIDVMRQAIKEQRDCCVTVRNYRKDGSIFWNQISISPVRDQQGKVTYYLGVQTDVTERKKAEEERQRYQSALQRMNRELYTLNNQLHRLVNLDGLTGVANRRCFDEHLEQEWRRCVREETPLSLIIGDVDYFKRYNDSYGHLQGDDCLKAVAQAIDNCVHRAGDLVARTGGEEFAVILPHTPLTGAIKIAEKVRENIKLLKIPHQSSSVSEYVSMSLGVASFIPSSTQSPKDLIAAADKALYLAKEQGRDRVVTCEET